MKLLALALYRLVWFVPTLLGLLVVTFVISRVVPADPVALVAGETATPAQGEALRHQLGYDPPLPLQFVEYVARLARGDMGTSIFTRRPIAEDLAHRLPAPIELTVVAMLVSVLVGIPLGVLSAIWRNSPFDHGLRVVTVSGLAIASFWLGIMLQLLFAMRLGWTPLNGRLQGFPPRTIDRKSTRLNSSHSQISYAVFCLKKKKQQLDTVFPPVMRPSTKAQTWISASLLSSHARSLCFAH